jgi:hypothetical protein
MVVAPDAAAYSSFYTSMMDPGGGAVNETAENFPGRVRIPPLPAGRVE